MFNNLHTTKEQQIPKPVPMPKKEDYNPTYPHEWAQKSENRDLFPNFLQGGGVNKKKRRHKTKKKRKNKKKSHRKTRKI